MIIHIDFVQCRIMPSEYLEKVYIMSHFLSSSFSNIWCEANDFCTIANFLQNYDLLLYFYLINDLRAKINVTTFNSPTLLSLFCLKCIVLHQFLIYSTHKIQLYFITETILKLAATKLSFLETKAYNLTELMYFC